MFVLLGCLFGAGAAWGAESPQWGGIGHVSQGFMLGDPTGAATALDDVEENAAPGAAMLLGGGGRMLLAGRVLLGGGGHGTFFFPSAGADATVMAQGGGGYLDAGVLLYNQERSWVYPFAGVALGGTDVLVQNASTTQQALAGRPLAPGSREVWSGGYTSVLVGAGVTRLFFDEETQGGMALDLQMAAMIPASGSLGDGLDGAPGGLVFRVNAGGGGFFY